VTRQATAAEPRGEGHAPVQPGRPTRKVVLPLLMSLGMLGIGLAVLFRSVADGDGVGVAFSVAWLALAAFILGRMILRIVGIRVGRGFGQGSGQGSGRGGGPGTGRDA
jgi:hypothetical protein